MRTFLSGLAERLLALAAGSIAARAESEAALAEAECLEQIESAAQRYEQSGNPRLAERLRRRAAGLTVDDPGAMAAPLLAAPKPEPDAVPQLTTEAKPKRRRSRTAEERDA